MAIDFNILKPIAPGTTVGTLQPQPSQMNELAGGLMQGLMQGQQLKSASLQNEANKIQLQQAQQGQADDQALRQASQQGEDAYEKTLIAQGKRADAMKYNIAKQEFSNSILQGKKSVADLSKSELELAETKAYIAGGLAFQAEAIPDPQERAKYWEQIAPVMNKKFKGLELPTTYNQNDNLGMMGASLKIQQEIAQNPQLQKNQYPEAAREQMGQDIANANASKGTPSNTAKLIQETNAARQAAGQPPLSQQEQADLLGQATRASVSTSKGQIDPVSQVNIGVTSDTLKELSKQGATSTKNLTLLNQMDSLSNSTLSGTSAGLQVKAGQLMSSLGVPVPDNIPASEVFDSLAKNAQLNTQLLLKGSTSDRDMDTVSKTGPQLNNTQVGKKFLISSAIYKETMNQQYNEFKQAWSQSHNASLAGSDEAWTNFVQSRNDFNPKTLKFDSKGINKKSWSPFLQEGYQAPQQTSTKPTTSLFEDRIRGLK